MWRRNSESYKNLHQSTTGSWREGLHWRGSNYTRLQRRPMSRYVNKTSHCQCYYSCYQWYYSIVNVMFLCIQVPTKQALLRDMCNKVFSIKEKYIRANPSCFIPFSCQLLIEFQRFEINQIRQLNDILTRRHQLNRNCCVVFLDKTNLNLLSNSSLILIVLAFLVPVGQRSLFDEQRLGENA